MPLPESDPETVRNNLFIKTIFIFGRVEANLPQI